MKTTIGICRLGLLCICFSIISNYIYAQDLCYDTVRKDIIEFLKVTESSFQDRDTENILLIRDAVTKYQIGNEYDYQWDEYKMEEGVKDGIYSVFPMSSFSEYTYYHILLVNRNAYRIINMRDPVMDNLAILVDFLQDNSEYTKEKALDYIRDFITIANANPSPADHYIDLNFMDEE